MIWEFIGHDPPLNSRRTLDQYGYPSLRDTRSRDDDQMLYKLTKERPCAPETKTDFYGQGSSSRFASDSDRSSKAASTKTPKSEIEAKAEDKEILNGNVLMVDQLWFWVLSSRKSSHHRLLTN